MWAYETYKKQTGFTIVELLVVVVVIAILASITIVSYNGITERTAVVVESASARNWEKSVTVAYVNNGALALPDPADGLFALYWCLGLPTDYPATADFPAGSCMVIDGSPEMPGLAGYQLGLYSQGIVQGITLSGSATSSKSYRVMTSTLNDNGTTRTLKTRGPMAYYPDANNNVNVTVSIVWFAKKAADCGNAKVNDAAYAGVVPTSGGVNCSYRVGVV